MTLDDDGNIVSNNQSKNETLIRELADELDILKDKSKLLEVEVNELKENRDDNGNNPVVETVKSEHIQNLEEQFKKQDESLVQLSETVDELVKFKTDKEAQDDMNKDKKFATNDQVDGKIQAVLEKLKNDNQMIWKDSVSLAEKQFNEKGIQETMDLLPTSLQGVTQLKSTINIVDGAYDQNDPNQPKPVINS